MELDRRLGAVFMFVGLAIQFASASLRASAPTVATVLGFVSGAALVYGGSRWSRGLAYSRWVGFFALLSFLGVGFLLMLPRRPRGKRLFGWFADESIGETDAHA